MPYQEYFELLRNGLKKRTQRKYKQFLHQYADSSKEREMEINNASNQSKNSE